MHHRAVPKYSLTLKDDGGRTLRDGVWFVLAPGKSPMACHAGAKPYDGPDHPYIDQP